jgi:hypothetical protein
LFILIAVKQVTENHTFLSWGGISIDAIFLCVQKFGLTIFFSFIAILGFVGYKATFNNLAKVATNGDNVTVINVDNKNSESIGYIATYIVPFLFQSFNGWYETFALIFLMVIIYRIYINSNMILINPILNFKYSIFQIEYQQQNGKIKNGLVVSKNKFLVEDTVIKIYPIGFKLFYANIKNDII